MITRRGRTAEATAASMAVVTVEATPELGMAEVRVGEMVEAAAMVDVRGDLIGLGYLPAGDDPPRRPRGRRVFFSV